jgi:osmotically inducible protein OsmC
MALSAGLGKAGFTPQRVSTTAKVTVDKVGEGFKITKIRLESQATVPNIDDAQFQEIAKATKTGCPISQALSAVPMELDAKLVK